jgi:hypothetical protein
MDNKDLAERWRLEIRKRRELAAKHIMIICSILIITLFIYKVIQ